MAEAAVKATGFEVAVFLYGVACGLQRGLAVFMSVMMAWMRGMQMW